MIYAHPDSIVELLKVTEPAKPESDGLGFRVSLFSEQIISSPYVPRTRKTGRLIWPKDPFVTYEDSDRSWGVSLGIAKEEEEAVFYRFDLPRKFLFNTTF